MKLLTCIIKNFKVLARSRAASFVILLAPLFIFLLLELAFNAPQQYSINIGVYSDAYSNTSNEIVSHLEESSFKVSRTETKRDCVANVKGGIFNTCVVFPSNMSAGHPEDFVDIIVDTSKSNMVFVIKDIITSSIETQSTELSERLTTDMINHITFIESTSRSKLKDSGSALEQVQNSIAKTGEAASKLKNMNFSYDLQTLLVHSEEQGVKISLTQSQNTIIKSKSLTTSIMNYFDGLKDDVEALNINGSSKQELLDYVNSTQARFNGIAQSIQHYANTSNASLTGVLSRFSALEDELESLGARLSDSMSLKTDSLNSLTEVTASLNTTNTLLKSINNSYSQILSRLAKVVIREPEEIVKPFSIKMISITPANSQVSLLFPQFLGIVILFISLIIPTVMAVNERRSIAAVRQALTPVYQVVYVAGIFLTNLIIVLTQVFIIMVLSKFLLGITIMHNPFSFILGVLLASSAFIMVGIFIGQIFSEEHNAIIAAVSLASLLLFISGAIMPLEAMPPAMFQLNLYNPFVVTISLIRKSIFFPIPFFEQSAGFLILLATWFGFYLATFLHISIIQKQHLIGRIYKKLKHS